MKHALPRHWTGAFVFRVAILPLTILAFLLTEPAFHMTGVAQAQEVRERRSIIDMIFGKRKKKVAPASNPVVRVKKPRRKKNVSTSNPSVADTEVTVAKQPDAKKILVIGDFMGSALADGLEMAFANDPGIVVEKRTDGSSGLVRSDHLDWPQTLTTSIDETKPALVVIMLGANDRQQMVVGGKREKFQTEPWKAEYEKRVAAIIDIARKNKIPFVWTGLPAFSSPSLTADAATLNNYYRAKSEFAGGEFVAQACKARGAHDRKVRGGQAGQGGAPVVELGGGEGAGDGGVAEAADLPEGVVGVLHRQGCPGGGGAGQAGGVGGLQIPR